MVVAKAEDAAGAISAHRARSVHRLLTDVLAAQFGAHPRCQNLSRQTCESTPDVSKTIQTRLSAKRDNRKSLSVIVLKERAVCL
jgi:hypothetical protein